jgi:hypothetical protein
MRQLSPRGRRHEHPALVRVGRRASLLCASGSLRASCNAPFCCGGCGCRCRASRQRTPDRTRGDTVKSLHCSHYLSLPSLARQLHRASGSLRRRVKQSCKKRSFGYRSSPAEKKWRHTEHLLSPFGLCFKFTTPLFACIVFPRLSIRSLHSFLRVYTSLCTGIKMC